MQANRYIFLVEKNAESRTRLVTAFLRSGYHVLATDRAVDAVDIIKDSYTSGCVFDLLILDMLDGEHQEALSAVQRINSELPVFLFREASDKMYVIELLNKKQASFLDDFIDMHINLSRGHAVDGVA